VIQRIQTVYLALAGVSFILLLLVGHVFEGVAADTLGWFTPAVAVLAGITALGSITTIFLYTDRQRQRSAVVSLQFLAVLTMAAYYGGRFMVGEMGIRPEDGAALGVFSLIAPPIGYVFLFMARRGIDRDITLIRSMDRLR
jgi:hypothetical protein